MGISPSENTLLPHIGDTGATNDNGAEDDERLVSFPRNDAIYDVLHGNCLDRLREIPDHSVNLVVTSPPYATRRQKTYGGTDPEHYIEWFLPISADIRRVLKPNGTFILNIKEHVDNGARHLYVLRLVDALCTRQGWMWTEEWPWIKRNCHPGRWPNRFRDAMERVYQFNVQRDFAMHQDEVRVPAGDWRLTRTAHMSEADRTRRSSGTGSGFGKNVSNWAGRDMVYPDNVLRFATECSNQQHPAAFPVALPDFFIRLFTRPGDLVLDPFSGSGTTGVAAVRLDRRYVGIEMVEDYVIRSRVRIEKALLCEK